MGKGRDYRHVFAVPSARGRARGAPLGGARVRRGRKGRGKGKEGKERNRSLGEMVGVGGNPNKEGTAAVAEGGLTAEHETVLALVRQHCKVSGASTPYESALELLFINYSVESQKRIREQQEKINMYESMTALSSVLLDRAQSKPQQAAIPHGLMGHAKPLTQRRNSILAALGGASGLSSLPTKAEFGNGLPSSLQGGSSTSTSAFAPAMQMYLNGGLSQLGRNVSSTSTASGGSTGQQQQQQQQVPVAINTDISKALSQSLGELANNPAASLQTPLSLATVSTGSAAIKLDKASPNQNKILRNFHATDSFSSLSSLNSEDQSDTLGKKKRGRPRLTPEEKKARGTCSEEGCTKFARIAGSTCVAHGGGNKCAHEECTKSARAGTDFCYLHGGKRQSTHTKYCIQEGCSKLARSSTRLCAAHGGGRRCQATFCTKSARGTTNFCISHGGGKRCMADGCKKSAQGSTSFCISHGGGRRCGFPQCPKSARGPTGFCKAHGTSAKPTTTTTATVPTSFEEARRNSNEENTMVQ